MSKFEQLGDKFNETNRKITEWRPKLVFDQEVAEYQKNNTGVSAEKVREIICEQKISAISQDVKDLKLLHNEKELRFIAPLSTEQKAFRELAAGLHEIFVPEEIKQLRNAADTGVWRGFPALPAVRESEIRGYYGKRFKKTPDVRIVREISTNLQLFEALASRISVDLSSVSFRDLRSAASNIDPVTGDLIPTAIGADIGKLLETKELLDAHYKQFERGLARGKERDTFIEESRKMARGVLSGAGKIAKHIGKGVGTEGILSPIPKAPSPSNIMGGFDGVAKIFGRGAWVLTKLAAKGIKLGVHYLKR